MGWNETCKKLRKDIFTTDVQGVFKRHLDHNMARVYESQEYIKTDVFGYKHRSITLISDGAHRIYRLMKHLYRYNRRLG